MGKSLDTLREQIKQKQDVEGFIKVTESPLNGISSEQKAQLNRRGNMLFNQGDIEGARKIFTATGYSDGLTRVGDYYKAHDRHLEALKEYCLAHNKNKAEEMYETIAQVVKQLINEN